MEKLIDEDYCRMGAKLHTMECDLRDIIRLSKLRARKVVCIIPTSRSYVTERIFKKKEGEV